MINTPKKLFSLRIVVPVLNEGPALSKRLATLQELRKQGAELVVVDGGSTDDSWARARPWVDRLLATSPGRARQMNLGAQDTGSSKASVLLFLHADTQLPAHALETIEQALRGHHWGRFDVALDSPKLLLRLVARLMNLRSRLTRICTGDQAMFVRADAFRAVGGFPDQALMEDIELSKRLNRLGPPRCLGQKVITSARKWERHGIWKTIALMWRLRWSYWRGAKPEDLALAYGYAAPPAEARASLAIFAKAPIPGMAKTRLIPVLGAAGAARQQRAFLHQSIQLASQSRLVQLTLWCAPSVAHPSFRALEKHLQIQCLPQTQGDLGERMSACTQWHFANHSIPLLIIGTDCPVLSPGHIQAAARALISHDVCVIPAEDGGYVLIGQRREILGLFSDIDWSTDRVLTQTRERLREAKVSFTELPSLWDVDEPQDWTLWQTMYTRAN